MTVSLAATVLTCAVAIPLGIALTRGRFRRYSKPIITVAGFGQAAPAIGLIALGAVLFGIGINLSAVVNSEVLAEHPELAEIFGQLSPKLTNEVMLELNAKVDTDGDDPAIVARDWLIKEGLLT